MSAAVLENPRLLVFETFVFSKSNLWWDYCVLNGKRHRALRGKWAIFVPSIGAKILLAEGDNCYCDSVSAPSKQDLLSGRWVPGSQRYSVADWENAYGKSATRRAAECFVAAQRLYKSGLGPQVTGLVAVKKFQRKSASPACTSAGFLVDDLRSYRRKKETTEEEMLACGVQPDKSKSCLHQQIRGYVSDLNSVVGVMPLNAEAEIVGYETEIKSALSG